MLPIYWIALYVTIVIKLIISIYKNMLLNIIMHHSVGIHLLFKLAMAGTAITMGHGSKQ